jgi:hypothetical protein
MLLLKPIKAKLNYKYHVFINGLLKFEFEGNGIVE